MKRKKRKGIQILLSVFLAICCICLITGAAYGIKGYGLYREAVEEKPVAQTVESIYRMEHFTPYEELPPIYRSAVISVEDHRFFSHNGIDPLAILRALWNDLKSLSFAEGGSTITQQLAKNLFFTQEKQLERKAAEVFAAWDLESRYEKEQIFELYVNTIYFGSGYYGIYDAAKGYFGKTPSELTDAEAVLLAGLPNAPTAYSLDRNPELARQRMEQVLKRMVDCQALTMEEADHLRNHCPI